MSLSTIECSDGVARILLCIDPRSLSTAQQKKMNFRMKRIFSNPRVVAGMRVITTMARRHASDVRATLSGASSLRVSVLFFFAYPKSAPKKGRLRSEPMPTGADLDNRVKAFNDALTKAGWWDDDRQITTLSIGKRLTSGQPRIEVTVCRDSSDRDDIFFGQRWGAIDTPIEG